MWSLLDSPSSLLGSRDPGKDRVSHRGLSGAGPSHFALRPWNSTDLATYIRNKMASLFLDIFNAFIGVYSTLDFQNHAQ